MNDFNPHCMFYNNKHTLVHLYIWSLLMVPAVLGFPTPFPTTDSFGRLGFILWLDFPVSRPYFVVFVCLSVFFLAEDRPVMGTFGFPIFLNEFLSKFEWKNFITVCRNWNFKYFHLFFVSWLFTCRVLFFFEKSCFF